MTLSSMTGFSRVSGAYADNSWVIEARSVNGRSLDIKTRYPNGFDFFDRLAKEIGKQFFFRGQISLSLNIEQQAEILEISINREILNQYLSVAHELTESGLALRPTADGIIALKGVIQSDKNADNFLDEGVQNKIQDSIRAVLESLSEARRSEGIVLTSILSSQMVYLEKLLKDAECLADEQAMVIKNRFVKRLEEFSVDPVIGEDRIIQEISILIAKADIREELDRLAAHINQVDQLLKIDGHQGRKLDFLAQEFMREANTLCSKSASTALTQLGIEMKTVIDQFREQTQNVE